MSDDRRQRRTRLVAGVTIAALILTATGGFLISAIF